MAFRAATMSSRNIGRKARMFPPQDHTRLPPLLQSRKQRPLKISIPPPPNEFDSAALQWCQLESYLGYSDADPEFDTVHFELPATLSPTTCESLNSCLRGESFGSVAPTPSSGNPPRERCESGSSLRGFDLLEVVDTSESSGGHVMDQDNNEEDPPKNTTEEETSANSAAYYGQNPLSQLWVDMPGGAPVLTTAGAAAFQALGNIGPPNLLQRAGRPIAPAVSIAPTPQWQNPPYTVLPGILGAGSQVPTFLNPPAAHPFEANLQNQQPQPQIGATAPQSQADIFTDLLGAPNLGYNPGGNPAANTGVNPNPGANQPVTYDLREVLGAIPPEGVADGPMRRYLELLLHELERTQTAQGGSQSRLPSTSLDPQGRSQVSIPWSPPESAAPSFPPQLALYQNVPPSALLALSSVPQSLERPSGLLAGRPAQVPERLVPGLEPLRGTPNRSATFSELPPTVLQRVSSEPLGRRPPPPLVLPSDVAQESLGAASAVQLASSEGSPAATSAPPKRAKKRNSKEAKGKAAEERLERLRAPSAKRPSSAAAERAPSSAENPPQVPAQNPSGGAGPKRTVSMRSVQTLDEPGADVGGQGTWRSPKKPRDASHSMSHSSGGASVAGSLDRTGSPFEREAPKETAASTRRQERKIRMREQRQTVQKQCSCSQDWPSDIQELRTTCEEQSRELFSMRLQRDMMHRRDSLHTQRIEELNATVAGLQRALADARAALDARSQAALPQGAAPPQALAQEFAATAEEPRAALARQGSGRARPALRGGAAVAEEARAQERVRGQGARRGRGGRGAWANEEESNKRSP